MPRQNAKSSPDVAKNSPPRYYLRSSQKEKSEEVTADANDREFAKKLREERQKIVIWRRPFTTIYYFFMELVSLAYEACGRLAPYWPQLLILGTVFALSTFAYHYLEFANHYFFVYLRKRLVWCLWWIFLGILSSVGLGTGLHTFVLYLGPHIARVTLAAYECSSVDFPEPPYPDDVICPSVVGDSHQLERVSIWLILSKVRLEAMMWGLGTAIGELPPYFVARAARLSGNHRDDGAEGDDDDEIRELENLLASRPEQLALIDRLKLKVHWLIQRVGFWGILACASIPNPLFDLAGITCGHFLVPFTTFFGATAIGKAIIKVHIQQLFVIFLFSKHHVERLVQLIGQIPGGIGDKAQQPFSEYLEKQREHLHTGGEQGDDASGSILATIFGGLVTAMLVYFAISIVNSLAQSYHVRISKKIRK